MPLTRTRTLTYKILAVTITADWGALFVVAEMDGDNELRRIDLAASPAECAPLLAAEPAGGQTLQQAMGGLAYTLVEQLLGAA
jgi:hypothetical protein